MTEEVTEYQEPTNEQLASFLVVYAKQIPGMGDLQLDAPLLERLMDENPQFRAGALRHHKKFQEEIVAFGVKIAKGELQCEHIRGNGKRCPNHNEPGDFYCGLHKKD